MSTTYPQDQGSSAMASPLPDASTLAPLLTSPLLPTSSPEALLDSDIPSTSRPLSTASTPLPASSETSLPSTLHDADGPRQERATVPLLDRQDRRPSGSSIRSHPSILRYSNVDIQPRSPSFDNPISPTQSVFVASPASPSFHRLSYQTPVSPDQQRRNSQDRRVRSEGTSLSQTHRPSFIGVKNPSVLTGGYHSSDSESGSAKENDDRKQPPPTFPMTASASYHGINPAHLVAQERRRRAQSLMAPLLNEFSPSGEGSGSGQSARRNPGRLAPKSPTGLNGRDRSGSRSSKLNKSITAQAPDRRTPSSTQSNNRSAESPTRARPNPHSPLTSAMSSRTPSTYFRDGHAESSRHASFNIPMDGLRGTIAEPSPSQHIHESPARSREVERLRREEGASHPEGSRKGKEKARESVKQNPLFASLGLGTGMNGQQALAADQINDLLLLGDSDVGNALRMLQDNAKSSPVYSRDTDRARRLSTSTHSPERSKRKEPFIATAPPALTGDEGHHRDRTVSVSSSLAPSRSRPGKKSSWDEDAEIARRRREARRRHSTIGEAEGHIPFTHHIPARLNETIESSGEESADDENDNQTLDNVPAPSSTHDGDTSHLRPPSETSRQSDDKKKKRKGRFSQLFHRRKKSLESITREVTRPAEVRSSPIPATRATHGHSLTREQYLEDLNIRQLERERRENEIADERLYQAFLQVTAHPSSSRKAERTISHLRAFYNQVYDSIDNPPRLNYLSVLRWKKATQEQTERRARWKSEQAERHKDPTSFPSAWTQVYNSPNSIGSAAHLRPSVSRDSQPMSLGTSGTGGNLRSSTSVNKNGEGRGSGTRGPGAEWLSTVDDFIAYKEANGKVDYFMPPQVPETASSATSMNKSQTSYSNKLDDFRPGVETRDVDPSGSVTGDRRVGSPTPRITSASMLSVAATGTASPSGSNVNLARTASNETSSKPNRSPLGGHGRARGHRSHQSMSAMTGSTTNLANAIKAPFHRMKEGARRQLTLPYHSGSLMNGSESAIEESPSAKQQVRPRTSGHTPLNRTPVDSMRSHLTPFHRTPLTSLTDNERERDGEHPENHEHRIGVFLKGRNLLHRIRGHDEGEYVISESPKTRTEEIRELSAILEREKMFEARQPGRKRRATILAQEAEQQLAIFAADEYAERSKAIVAARARVDSLTAALGVADRSMTYFIREVGQIQSASKISAEVDLEFPGLEELRERYLDQHRRRNADDGEMTPPWIRSLPPSRRGSRRYSTLTQTTLPAFHSIGAKPWPRRAVLDIDGNRVDPIQQVEMALVEAQESAEGLQRDKDDAVFRLRSMGETLDDMIKQKNDVREWLDRTNQFIKKNQDQVNNMERELKAGLGWSEFLGPFGDRAADFALRYPFRFMLTAIVKTIKIIGFFPLLWWDAGVFGKIVGSVVSVVVLMVAISWVT